MWTAFVSTACSRPVAISCYTMAAEQDFVALPQRAPRQRGRALKRTRLDDGEAKAEAGGNLTPAAAAAAELGSPPEAAAQPAAEEQQDLQQQQSVQDAHEGEGEADEEPNASPVAVPLDLPEYRSAAVQGHKFECACLP